MDFAIRKDARFWFRDLEDGFDNLFDPFYFCFMAGIAEMRKKDVPASETDSFVDNFPIRHYGNRARLLVGLFLSRELEYLGIAMNEKKTVHDAISKLVRPEAPNFLSDAGAREFNKFAHGGYEVLLDWFDDRPRSLETFLRAFWQRIEAAELR
ncbi:MAG: hypothetical protein OXJ64_17695 [Boseongicola sp.]|nr:hypothetical protein [Boseongicola sp.]